MITYFKLNDAKGKFISINDETDEIIFLNKFNLQSEKQYLQEQIQQTDPNLPTTNAGWITWAKEHYPYLRHDKEIARLAEVQSILDAIKAL